MINNLKINKNKFFGLILMISAILASPFYLYASGLPQPAHILMLIASIFIVLINKDFCIQIVKSNKYFTAFLSVVLIVNLAYFIMHEKSIFIINSIYWMYGVFIMMAVMCVFDDKWLNEWVKKFILFQLSVVSVSYLIGWGGFSFWPRYEYFLNGPNQLAYFSLALLIIYTVLENGEISFGLMCAYFLTACAIVMTGARSMYIAFVPIIVILLLVARGNYGKMLLVILVPIAVYYIFVILELPWYVPTEAERLAGKNYNVGNNTLNRFAELCISCNSTDYYSIEYQLRARGYLRLMDYPQYLIFGAGQGMDERFGELNGFTYEIHSSLFGLWFYYGLTGIVLFLIAIYKLFKNKVNLIFLAPVFVYGLFTYGLRSPYFWLILGFVALSPNILNRDKKCSERITVQ
jgi:hypothetical protein